MAVSLGPDGLVLDNTTLPHDAPGLIVQTVVFQPPSSADNFSVTSGNDSLWWSTTFTTKEANSKILIHYHSGQINANTTSNEVNPRLEWSLDSTTRGAGMDVYREHNHEWYQAMGTSSDKRFFISGYALSSTLSTAGSHTIRCFAGAYNGTLVFSHQGESNAPLRRPTMVLQELTT
jgi:hypothetical protein